MNQRNEIANDKKLLAANCCERTESQNVPPDFYKPAANSPSGQHLFVCFVGTRTKLQIIHLHSYVIEKQNGIFHSLGATMTKFVCAKT